MFVRCHKHLVDPRHIKCRNYKAQNKATSNQDRGTRDWNFFTPSTLLRSQTNRSKLQAFEKSLQGNNIDDYNLVVQPSSEEWKFFGTTKPGQIQPIQKRRCSANPRLQSLNSKRAKRMESTIFKLHIVEYCKCFWMDGSLDCLSLTLGYRAACLKPASYSGSYFYTNIVRIVLVSKVLK